MVQHRPISTLNFHYLVVAHKHSFVLCNNGIFIVLCFGVLVVQLRHNIISRKHSFVLCNNGIFIVLCFGVLVVVIRHLVVSRNHSFVVFDNRNSFDYVRFVIRDKQF